MNTIQLAPKATEADIIQALASLGTGGTLILPRAESISIRSGLVIDVTHRDITLNLNGSTLVKAGNVSVITGTAQHDIAVSVRLGLDADRNTTVIYEKVPAALEEGSWVKIVADNLLPSDMVDANTARMGQALEVLSIEGNTVTFKGALVDQANYATNVRATTYQGGELVIMNGQVVGDQTQLAWNSPLVQLRSLVDARIEDITVRDGVGRGIQVVDGVNNLVTEVTVKNLADGGSAALGIGVSSLSSTGTTISGYYAENVTHAADNNAIGVKPGSAYVVQYGADIGMSVENAVAYGTRNFAFSWHSEAVGGAFTNVMAFDSFGFLMARGIGGHMADSGGAGNVRGIMFYEYGTDDARQITIDNVTLKETQNYAVYSVNSPEQNFMTNSYFESATGNLTSSQAVSVTDSTFIKTPSNPDDVILGGSADELLLGGRGNDQMRGGGGNDYIWGGLGADILAGGEGRDRFAYHNLSEGGDTIIDFDATPSGDAIDLSVLAAKHGWKAGDPIANGYVRFVQIGPNTEVLVDVRGDGSQLTCLATLLNVDVSKLCAANIRLGLSADEISYNHPGIEDELLAGREGAQTDSTGDDLYNISSAEDIVREEPGGGRDRIIASVQLNSRLPENVEDLTLTGTANLSAIGNDLSNEIVGNEGNNTLLAGGGNDVLLGGAGNDTLAGSTGDDVLIGGTGDDLMVGGTGNDTFKVDSAADRMFEDAGGGYDRIITDVQLTEPLAANIEALTLTGTANLSAVGNELDNEILGNTAGNIISGGGGNDTIYGGSGADWLDGGTGKDVLTGGEGNDTFYIASIAEAGDTISDFVPGEDKIALSAAGFGLSDVNDLAFIAGAEVSAVTGKATLLYDTATGHLLWDPDGAGANPPALLATLENAPPLSLQDITVT